LPVASTWRDQQVQASAFSARRSAIRISSAEKIYSLRNDIVPVRPCHNRFSHHIGVAARLAKVLDLFLDLPMRILLRMDGLD
jgi:hypothetical protein